MRIAKLAAALLAATALTVTAAHAQTGGTTIPGNGLDQMFPAKTAPTPPAPAAPPFAPPGVTAPVAPAQASQPAPIQRPARQDATPSLPPFLNPPTTTEAVAPVAPPMSVQQALTPPVALPSPAQVQAIMAPPPPTPARDITISDNETSEKIESLNRQKRILDAEFGVEKARVEVAKQLSELAKAQGANRPSPTPAQIIQMQQAQQQQQAAIAPVAEPDPARELSTLAQRMSVISIAGPRESLRATIMVAGFGEVRAREGGVLPGGLKVASITDQGVAVTRGSARPVLLQFASAR